MTSFIRTIFIFIFISSTSLIVVAQGDFGNSNPEKGNEPLPQNIRETLAKQRVAEEKKEFEELLEKGNKAAKMSEELQKSFAENNKFTSQDQTKLKDLEKLLKKIRKDLGGGEDEDEDDEPEDKPKSMANAISELADTTANLYQEIKKTSRLTISAVAIKSSNTILTIVKFLRFGK